jgi:acetyl esterase/lipase
LLAAASLLSGCASVGFTIANLPARFGEIERRADAAYGRLPRQKLDVYVPRGARDAPAPRPVVVFFYGGGWERGDKGDYRFVGAALAARGFVTVLPDYRLYPEARFPEFVVDGAHAVAWVQQHAREFGGDPERVVLMGHSAGGHMAAMLALSRTYLEAAGARTDWIRGFVGLAGPYVLEPNSAVLDAIFAPPFSAADWQPVNFVDARAPPALLAHGEDDSIVSLAETEALRDAMVRAGAAVETRVYRGRNHADTVAAFAAIARFRAPVLEDAAAFVERVTATAPASASVAPGRNGPSP